MTASLAADALVVLHGCFVVFVALGGLLLIKWPRLVWLHLPAVVWGTLVELCGWVCPLTPWESHLRAVGGGTAVDGSCIEYYLTPLLYPSWLSRRVQIGLGLAVVVVNLTVYAAVWHRLWRGSDDATVSQKKMQGDS